MKKELLRIKVLSLALAFSHPNILAQAGLKRGWMISVATKGVVPCRIRSSLAVLFMP